MTTIATIKPAANNLNTPVHKRDYNEEHFTEAAPEYDRATRMLSLGGDAVWKRRLIEALPPLLRYVGRAPLPVDVPLADIAGVVARRLVNLGDRR